MLNTKLSYTAIIVSSILGISSCGGDSANNEANISVPFSLGISDAPVNGTDKVVITIEQIKLIPIDDDDIDDDDDDDDDDDSDDDDDDDSEDDDDDSDDDDGRETITIDTFNGMETVSIDLKQYMGNEQLTIISEDDGVMIPLGHYKMELVIDSASSFVTLTADELDCDPTGDFAPQDSEYLTSFEGEGCYDLKIPSSRLKLGHFAVVLGATETEAGPAYTVEFDLTQSLVLRGNNPVKNGYILKPHGIRIASSTASGDLEGDVGMSALSDIADIDPLCNGPMHTVYLYEGDQTDLSIMLADNVAPNAVPNGYIKPFASTLVMLDDDDDDQQGIEQEYEYEFGFVPTGIDGTAIYTVALGCNIGSEGSIDEPLSHDGYIIGHHENLRGLVTINTGEETELNLPVGWADYDDD